jgi:hypothetical protein
MYALYGKPVSGLILVGGKVGVTQPPMFYTGVYPVPMYQIDNDVQLMEVKTALDKGIDHPNYVLFYGLDDLESRVQRIESTFHMKLIFDRRVETSFLDQVFYRLNPRNNKNETIVLYTVL